MGEDQRARPLRAFNERVESLLDTRLARFIFELRAAGIDRKLEVLEQKSKTERMSIYAFEELFHNECESLSWNPLAAQDFLGTVTGDGWIEPIDSYDKAVDQFLLVLRSLIGEDEISSFKNLTRVYSESPISDLTRNLFHEEIDRFEKHLQKVQVVQCEDGIRRWSLSKIIFEADRKSNDPDKKTMHSLTWIMSFVYREFVNLLLVIRNIANINRKALLELEKRKE